MNIHEVVRAVSCLEDVLAQYGVDAAQRLLLVASFQNELIDRELKEPDAIPPQRNGAGSAPGSVTTVETGRGFKLTALTDRGRAGLSKIERALAPLVGDAP
jgi:hypothetical protein